MHNDVVIEKPAAGSDLAHEPVGYCNPPKHSRFKKGQSGNPKGRPKRIPDVQTLREQLFLEPVTVELDGESRKLPRYLAAEIAMLEKARQGNPTAYRLVRELVKPIEGKQRQSQYMDTLLAVDDEMEEGPD
jgi:hypothetical protein